MYMHVKTSSHVYSWHHDTDNKARSFFRPAMSKLTSRYL